jgi:hypothetical protein
MAMVAIMVESHLRREASEEVRGRVEGEILSVARQQPGYRGYLSLDKGGGQGLAIYLWESEEAAQRGQAAISEQATKLNVPYELEAPRILRATVTTSDFPAT